MRFPRSARAPLVALAIVLSLGSASAGEFSGEVAAQGRIFFQDAPRSEQSDALAAIRLEPDFFHDWANGDQRVVAHLFGRLDSADEERTHFDIRELYWRGNFARDLDLYVGLRKVFWGVTETFHLVDILNQSDMVENIDQEQKLGQPMVAATLVQDWGTFDAFLMPWFRERNFAGSEGRFSLPLPVRSDDPTYESSAGREHLDWALRYSHYFGDMDIGVSFFSGTDRAPLLISNSNGSALVPHYAQLHHLGLDAQWTHEAWLWKLEAVGRDQNEESLATVGGFEYSFYGLAGGDSDLGVLLEVQFDNQEGALADNDLAVGGRWTLNDVQDSQLLAFASRDLDLGTIFASLEASRRLGQNWGASLQSRFFLNANAQDPGFVFRQDDYLEFELVRYF